MKIESRRLTFSVFLILALFCSELPIFFRDVFAFHASASTSDKLVNPYPPNGSAVVASATKSSVKVIDPDEGAMKGSFNQTALLVSTPTNFTIIALPDTQYYSQDFPRIFDNQTQWVVDNVESMNIVFVSQEGDLVNNYSDLSQWNNANQSLSMLDYRVPWGVLPGYNDGVYAGDLTNYNSYFGYDRFNGESWYGGGYQNTNTNSFQLFSVGQDQYLIFDFQYNPSNSVLRWANRTIDNYPGKRVIVTTHYYLDVDGNRTTIGEQQIWQKFVKPHADQVFLVLCAGTHGEARRTDVVGGHSVYQLLANYQTRTPYGGNGWLRTLTFCPAEDKIYVKTYSPYLNSYETDSDSQFTLNYSMTHPSYTLTVNVTPTGSGTVIRNNTDQLYYYGDIVQLTAEPNLGWAFSNWSGDLIGNTNPTVIIMDGNKTVTAAFTQLEYTLTVNVSPAEGGLVNRSSTGPYHLGDDVQLTAIPTTGWAFSGWSGDLSGSVNPVVMTMDGNKTVSAVFTYHDVAVTGVAPSSSSVYAGNDLNITVTVINKGLNSESFNVTLFCNATSIATQTASNLTPSSTATLTFAWNTSGYAYGYYTVSANAMQVPGETNTFDNVLAYNGVTLRIPGDVNADGIVDLLDAAGISAHWYPGPPIGPLLFNPNFDTNGDGLIDVLDAALVNAYWTGPPKGPLAP